MINKTELTHKISHLSQDIFEFILKPICGEENFLIDPFITDLSCYTFANKELTDEVLNAIYDRYLIREMSPIDFVFLFRNHTVASIALYILCFGEYDV